MEPRRSTRISVRTAKSVTAQDDTGSPTEIKVSKSVLRRVVKKEEITGEASFEYTQSRSSRGKRRADSVSTLDAKSPKKARAGSKYAPPEKYAHLESLTDNLAEDLDGTLHVQ